MKSIQEESDKLFRIGTEVGLKDYALEIFIKFMMVFDPRGHENYAREWAERLFIDEQPPGLDKKWHPVLKRLGYSSPFWEPDSDVHPAVEWQREKSEVS